MKKVIIIAVIIAIFALIFFIGFKKWSDMQVLDRNGMIRYNSKLRELMDKKIQLGKILKVRYSDSGNMNGNIYEVELDVEKLELSVRNAEMHSDTIKVRQYFVNNEDIAELLNKINEYNLPVWSFLEYDNENVVLDGSIPVFTMIYDNSEFSKEKRKYYSISHYLKIPEGGMTLLRDTEKELFSLIKEENLIKEFEEE